MTPHLARRSHQSNNYPKNRGSNRTAAGRRPLAAIAAATLALLVLSACAPASAEDTETSQSWTFTNDLGSVELPGTIKRVVSVDFYTPAALIDAGVTPVGVVNTYFTDTEGKAIPTAYTSAIKSSGAESIGEYYELNVEAVAKAQPDVILATDDFLPMNDPLRPQLEKIAPIVTFTARDALSWKTRSDQVAEIVKHVDTLEPIREKYLARLNEVKAEHKDFLTDKTMAVFVPSQEATWGTYASTHFTGGVWSDLGARYREQQSDEINPAGFPNWFSYEELGRINNADVLFYQAKDDPRTTLADNVIWQNLNAVKSGLVFPNIDRSATGSYGWALENLNDIDALLDGVEAVKSGSSS
ncbi:ABC transporter substrate-binding protein [Paenarthrobacter sp. NPDC018779]|uniref:ABC transporter substrate-binding protein n=1 Tax=Paenarthrobacter sp. NPDC018779 TaxID=3364375 RepID=UPI0037C62406